LYNKFLTVQVKNSFAPKSGKYNRRCPKYRQTARWHLSHFFLNTQQLNVKKARKPLAFNKNGLG
jgi:hypothetical protein